MSMNPIWYLIGGVLLVLVMTIVLRKISELTEKKNDDSWAGEIPLVIYKIVDESHNVKSFYLKRIDGKNFPKFKPGQFLSFQIGKSKRIYRSYSLSSSSRDLSHYRISIKLLENGLGSSWFFRLKIGDIVHAHAPTGLFSDQDVDKKVKRVYIAGGIGITPFIPMVHNACEHNIEVDLFYGMQSESDLVFHEQLSELASKNQKFNYFPILSSSQGSWQGDKGFITFEYLKEKKSYGVNHQYYLCGPKVMTEGLISSLKGNNVGDKNIFIEEFFTQEVVSKGTSKVDCTITFNSNKLHYNSNDTILDFLEDEDQDILFSCRSGVCGVCKCKLISGEVDSLTNSGLTDDEKDEGYILTCVSRPKGDIELESDN